MKFKEKIAVVFCTEKGVLENQAKLLVNSGIKFAGNDFDFFSYSPRKKCWPSDETVAFLKAKNVKVFLNEQNKIFESYPVANKMLACQYFASILNNYTSIMFVDTDTVFLNSVNRFQQSNDCGVYLRPVDNKGPGSEGVGDPNDLFWKKVFSLCEVDFPEPSVWTTVRPNFIRNYFNAGFVWVNKLTCFFQQWYDDFINIVESDLRPFGWVSRDGDDFRCLDQVALAVTATRYQKYLKILPETYNYPIPFRPTMHVKKNHPGFQDLVHVHYHKWFQHPKFLNHVAYPKDLGTEQYRWLASQLPLMPTIDDAFKK